MDTQEIGAKNHRILHTILLTLLLFSVFGLGIGVGFFLPKNEEKLIPVTPKYVKPLMTSTPTVISTITPTASATPMPDLKTLTFKIMYPYSPSSAQTITLKAPLGSELIKGEMENDATYSVNIISTAGAKYSLIISIPGEGSSSTYKEGVDIGSSPFFARIYRGLNTSTADGAKPYWSYVSDMILKGSCGSDELTSNYKPPCGGTVLGKDGTGKNKYDVFLAVNCFTDNEKGLEQCDNIVKSIVVKH